MPKYSVRIEGTAPLLMHSIALANPFNPIVKQIKEITGKRKKTEDDLLKLSRLEWEGGMYRNDKGPFLPGAMLQASMIRFAGKMKAKSAAKIGIVVTPQEIPLQYKGPKDLEEMAKDPSFMDIRAARLKSGTSGGAVVMRSRPIFKEWSAEFEINYDESQLSPDQVLQLIKGAGQTCGIGDYLPQYGRFSVQVKDGSKWKEV